MSVNKKIHVIGGGTFAHIAPHFAFCAPAHGQVARDLTILCRAATKTLDVHLHLTKMCGIWEGNKNLETNEDIARLIDSLVDDPRTKIVFIPAALCDYEPAFTSDIRFKTRENPEIDVKLVAAEKVVKKIREKRKDIFAVAFKATHGYEPKNQYIAGLELLKESSVNLVLANDTKTKLNMIITPEEAVYHQTTNRGEALKNLVEMALLRSHLTFTRSTVKDGKLVPWSSDEIPDSLRTVVDYCVHKNAYKPFKGSTVGHFACKVNDNTFLTSVRKSNFNDLDKNGLVRIVTDGPDTVFAYGAKPSVGGQSQRIVFEEHPEYDCIVHFHCEKRPESNVPVVSQREVECGSHQCGQNTSHGLAKFGNLSAVFLDNHGPNITFNRSIDPKEVIDFIESNFDLETKTGGYTFSGNLGLNNK